MEEENECDLEMRMIDCMSLQRMVECMTLCKHEKENACISKNVIRIL